MTHKFVIPEGPAEKLVPTLVVTETEQEVLGEVTAKGVSCPGICPHL